MAKPKTASEILKAIDYLNSAFSKIEDFDLNSIDFSDRVLDNRIITLEGYLRFLEREGIPRLKSLTEKIEGDQID
ncbi:MAG: hypothetical protein ACOCV3_01130 [Halanaerobiales bacterium]